jgi:hypothetical protein
MDNPTPEKTSGDTFYCDACHSYKTGESDCRDGENTLCKECLERADNLYYEMLVESAKDEL